MNDSKPMTLLLLEDDKITTKEFESYLTTRTDVTLVAKTNSSHEALRLVKKYRPEAIIVDLELHDGIGSGFDFLQNFLLLFFANLLNYILFYNFHPMT